MTCDGEIHHIYQGTSPPAYAFQTILPSALDCLQAVSLRNISSSLLSSYYCLYGQTLMNPQISVIFPASRYAKPTKLGMWCQFPCL